MINGEKLIIFFIITKEDDNRKLFDFLLTKFNFFFKIGKEIYLNIIYFIS